MSVMRKVRINLVNERELMELPGLEPQGRP